MSEPDAVYRRAREVLEPILWNDGFRLAAECHYPESFGSAHADYKRRGLRLQLNWDGKDRHLWIIYARSEGNTHRDEYRGLETEPEPVGTPAIFLREGPTAERRIAALAEKLVAFLDREGAV